MCGISDWLLSCLVGEASATLSYLLEVFTLPRNDCLFPSKVRVVPLMLLL